MSCSQISQNFRVSQTSLKGFTFQNEYTLPPEFALMALSYLPVRDLLNLSLASKSILPITNTALIDRAWTYGYPSETKPSVVQAKNYLGILFRTLRVLHHKKLLNNSEVSSFTVTKRSSFVVSRWRVVDCEQTLITISKFCLGRFAEFYFSKALFKIPTAQYLHLFLLKARTFKPQTMAIDENTQEKLDSNLLLASKRSDNLAAELLIKNGALPIKYDSEVSAIHIASFNGNLRLLEMLLDHGADIEHAPDGGFSPLHHAISRRQNETVRYLISKGANPHGIGGANEWKPLHTAATRLNVEAIRLLLEHHVDIDPVDGDGQTPFWCIFNGCALLFQLIISLYDVDTIKDRFQKTLSTVTLTAKLLLENGANPNTTIFEEQPIHLAARCGFSCFVDLLLSHGAQVNTRSRNGYTPLHHAANCNNFNLVTYLLDRGAEIDSQTAGGHTALSLATRNRNYLIVESLLKAGANPNIGTLPPLHQAVIFKDVKWIKLLLKNGADINVLDGNEETPLQVAQENRLKKMVKYLKAHGAI